MLIPAAMNIESAADMLKSVPTWVREDQQKELSSFGAARLQALGISDLTDDVRKAYELGLQTARAILAGSGALLVKEIDPKVLL